MVMDLIHLVFQGAQLRVWVPETEQSKSNRATLHQATNSSPTKSTSTIFKWSSTIEFKTNMKKGFSSPGQCPFTLTPSPCRLPAPGCTASQQTPACAPPYPPPAPGPARAPLKWYPAAPPHTCPGFAPHGAPPAPQQSVPPKRSPTWVAQPPIRPRPATVRGHRSQTRQLKTCWTRVHQGTAPGGYPCPVHTPPLDESTRRSAARREAAGLGHASHPHTCLQDTCPTCHPHC